MSVPSLNSLTSPKSEEARLKVIDEARQKQLDDLATVVGDTGKKIETERAIGLELKSTVTELERRLNERDLELTEILKEKELLFAKLQIAHKDVAKLKAAQGNKTSIMKTLSSMFTIKGSQLSQKDTDFITTSKGLVKKTAEKPQEQTKIAPEPESTSEEYISPDLKLGDSNQSGNGSDEEDTEETEEEILKRIRARLEDDS